MCHYRQIKVYNRFAIITGVLRGVPVKYFGDRYYGTSQPVVIQKALIEVGIGLYLIDYVEALTK